MGPTTLGSVLFVCHGNVCRSVYGQQLLQARFGDRHPAYAITSAGVAAEVGLRPCALVAGRLRERGVAPAEHVPTRLSTALVAAADLVLCATAAERSAVALRQPAARDRAFTLQEAGRLSAWDREHGGHPVGTPAVLAERLRAARGRVSAPVSAPVRRRWWQRPVAPAEPWDIVDGHHLAPATHVATLDLVEEAVETVALALGANSPVTPQEGR